MAESIIDKALSAKRESASVEFKQTFDPASRQHWCEIVKDIVALANSGGGAIVFGADNKGQPVAGDLTGIANIDPATISDRIFQYTAVHCCQVEVREVQKSGQNLIVWLVGAVGTPLVFSEPGTYPIEGGKQRTAFGRGTIYFRHGAKSEPGATEDLSQFLDRRLEWIRKEWLGGVRKVVNAPTGSRVAVLPPEVTQSDSPDAAPIRITDDPGAPAYRVVDPDTTHPYRQKELIAEVRKGLRSLRTSTRLTSLRSGTSTGSTSGRSSIISPNLQLVNTAKNSSSGLWRAIMKTRSFSTKLGRSIGRVDV